MALGYHGKLYVLAFDHRDSFQRKLFGIEGDPTPEQTAAIADAKHVIFEAMLEAVRRGQLRGDEVGVLIDEQFGGDIPAQVKTRGLKLSMPVERSGQAVFDFEYGDQFGEHIERFDPDCLKVLVRYNPDGDSAANAEQLGKLRQLADWLQERGRMFMFELMVPAEPVQLESVGGDIDRYDSELRPALMCRAIAEIQDFGVEVDVWKIEGVETREDAEMLVAQARRGAGREDVACVLLGRGATDEKVEQWLRVVAPVEGFVGFAIGRSIWWDALAGFLDGSVPREDVVQQIADKYLRLIQVYEEQGSPVA